MAATVVSSIFSAAFSQLSHPDIKLPSEKQLKRNLIFKRGAVASERTTSTTTSFQRVVENKSRRAEAAQRVEVEDPEECEGYEKSLKDYFDETRDMIRSADGPPRWFSPLESRSHTPDSPLLMYLPGKFAFSLF